MRALRLGDATHVVEPMRCIIDVKAMAVVAGVIGGGGGGASSGYTTDAGATGRGNACAVAGSTSGAVQAEADQVAGCGPLAEAEGYLDSDR